MKAEPRNPYDFSPPPDAPRVTCTQCGHEYVDDSDWSGPAHNQQDCIRVLRGLLADLYRTADGGSPLSDDQVKRIRRALTHLV